jgi:hypothetical protein
MNAEQEIQFEQDYDKVLESGFLFAAKDENGKWTVAEALRQLRFYTRLYIEKNNASCSSQSAFQMVRDAMASERQLVPIASEPDEEPVTLTASQYQSMPKSVTQRRYQQEPLFKAAVDKLFAEGRV